MNAPLVTDARAQIEAEAAARQAQAQKLVTDAPHFAPHSLSEIFPPIEGEKFEELKASIATSGILDPIHLYEGKILDGRNRHRAALASGHKWQARNFVQFTGTAEQAEAFVIARNFHRRHLTTADRRAFVKHMVERYPGKSNREYGRLCGLTHVTIAEYLSKTDKVVERYVKELRGLSAERRDQILAKLADSPPPAGH